MAERAPLPLWHSKRVNFENFCVSWHGRCFMLSLAVGMTGLCPKRNWATHWGKNRQKPSLILVLNGSWGWICTAQFSNLRHFNTVNGCRLASFNHIQISGIQLESRLWNMSYIYTRHLNCGSPKSVPKGEAVQQAPSSLSVALKAIWASSTLFQWWPLSFHNALQDADETPLPEDMPLTAMSHRQGSL